MNVLALETDTSLTQAVVVCQIYHLVSLEMQKRTVSLFTLS